MTGKNQSPRLKITTRIMSFSKAEIEAPLVVPILIVIHTSKIFVLFYGAE